MTDRVRQVCTASVNVADLIRLVPPAQSLLGEPDASTTAVFTVGLGYSRTFTFEMPASASTVDEMRRYDRKSRLLDRLSFAGIPGLMAVGGLASWLGVSPLVAMVVDVAACVAIFSLLFVWHRHRHERPLYYPVYSSLRGDVTWSGLDPEAAALWAAQNHGIVRVSTDPARPFQLVR